MYKGLFGLLLFWEWKVKCHDLSHAHTLLSCWFSTINVTNVLTFPAQELLQRSVSSRGSCVQMTGLPFQPLITVQMRCVNSWLHITELPFFCLFWPSKAFETTVSFIYTDTYSKFSHAFFLVKADTANIPRQLPQQRRSLLFKDTFMFFCTASFLHIKSLYTDSAFRINLWSSVPVASTRAKMAKWEWLITENDAWLDFKMNFLKKENNHLDFLCNFWNILLSATHMQEKSNMIFVFVCPLVCPTLYWLVSVERLSA